MEINTLITLSISVSLIFLGIYVWYEKYMKSHIGGREHSFKGEFGSLGNKMLSSIYIEKNILSTLEFGRLAESIFHTLTNHISGIFLWMESYIESGHKSYKKSEMIVGAMSNIKSLISNVRNVIGHKKDTSIKTIKLSQSIDTIKTLYSHHLMENKIKFNIENFIDPTVPLSLLKMNQILMNLISNSIDSFNSTNTEDKYINIVSNIDLNQNMTEITITDNGKGMPKNLLEKVGKIPFSTKDDGTGSGLIHVYNLVQELPKGNLSIKSDLGKGTSAKISFEN